MIFIIQIFFCFLFIRFKETINPNGYNFEQASPALFNPKYPLKNTVQVSPAGMIRW